ncbi:MAG: type I glutamate--ammonia ligase [Deltaproteobacteria bacterium]|nr:type I glutamate--ammonia ligase [Deltaproteobacteria bacterium]
MFKDAEDLLRQIREPRIKMVDLRFCNLFGGWHHLTLPASRVDETVLERGDAFDGSSVPGYSKLESGDLALKPDVTTAFEDPFFELPTISVICSIVEAGTGKPYARDARGICIKAEEYLKSTGFATHSQWGPELEFYVFDDVDHGGETNFAQYKIDSEEAVWNAGRPDRKHLGYSIPRGGGYHACPPQDRLAQLRGEAVDILEQIGVPIRYHHHEVGGPGQCEIEPLLGPMLRMGDAIMLIKYVVRMVADRRGKTATFMPKPLYGEAGSGLHFHQQLFKGTEPVFYNTGGYAGLSDAALWYIAGLLDHGPSLLAITNPSTNSFKRLVPGYEAPVNLFFSLGNRSAAIRVPKYATQPDEKRFEFRPPDATCNGYLAMAAMLMAGIDGMKRKLDPATLGFGPIDQNIFKWTEAERAKIRPLPDSLAVALRALASDFEYLLAGDVFPRDLIDVWIEKKSAEAREIQSRPHPHEFSMYFAV